MTIERHRVPAHAGVAAEAGGPGAPGRRSPRAGVRPRGPPRPPYRPRRAPVAATLSSRLGLARAFAAPRQSTMVASRRPSRKPPSSDSAVTAPKSRMPAAQAGSGISGRVTRIVLPSPPPKMIRKTTRITTMITREPHVEPERVGPRGVRATGHHHQAEHRDDGGEQPRVGGAAGRGGESEGPQPPRAGVQVARQEPGRHRPPARRLRAASRVSEAIRATAPAATQGAVLLADACSDAALRTSGASVPSLNATAVSLRRGFGVAVVPRLPPRRPLRGVGLVARGRGLGARSRTGRRSCRGGWPRPGAAGWCRAVALRLNDQPSNPPGVKERFLTPHWLYSHVQLLPACQ